MFRPYLRVFRVPGALVGFGATFLGSLPISMLGLSELLLIQSTTGSMAQAGAVSGALAIGNACGLLLQGRLIDRYGQTVVLVPAALACGSALVGLTVAAVSHGPLPLLIILAAISGVAIPAVITCMRILIPEMMPADGPRRSAYALLGTQFNLALISGPMLVSGLVVLAGPAAAVLVAAAAATVGGLVFAITPQSRRWRPARASDAERSHDKLPISGLLTPGLITVMVAGLGAGFAGGLVAVAIPAVALAHDAAFLAGFLFATSSAGNIIAGIVYGSRVWRLALRTQLIICQASGAVISGVLGFLTGHPSAMFPPMLANGAIQAPGGIATSALLDDVARPGYLGQSYTAMVAAGLAGSAIGVTAGGTLSANTAEWTLFGTAAVAGLAVATWTLVRRATLASKRPVAADRNGQDSAARPGR